MPGIVFSLNGQEICVTGHDPHTTLLEYLRQAGLTGAKEGCAEGECGACAVVVGSAGPNGRRTFQAVNSCLVLLPAVAGREIWTAESVQHGADLHPVQEALVRHGGSQCGYCTPGFVMSMWAEYYRPGRTGWDPEALGGNLCRCTGYRPIRDAALGLGTPDPGDRFWDAPPPPAPEPVAYAAHGVAFHRPSGLSDLFVLMDRHPDARLVAGGTDLVVEMNQQYSRWPALISLEAVAELRACTWQDDHVELGAACTLSELEEQVRGRIGLLDQLFPLFASRLIRNRATLGGNLATASPIGDAAPALLALDAAVRLSSRAGERLVPLDQFFTGYRRTVLAPGEVIAAVRIPRPFPALGRFYKVAKRRRDDISTVAGAFALDLDPDGRVSRVRLAYGGVAPTPVRCAAAEAALAGQRWDAAAVHAVQPLLQDAVQPIDDHRGSAAYRRALVSRLLEKFLHETGGWQHAVRA